MLLVHPNAIASPSSSASRLLNGRSLTPKTRSPARVKKSDIPVPLELSGVQRKMEDSDVLGAALSGSPPLKVMLELDGGVDCCSLWCLGLRFRCVCPKSFESRTGKAP